MLGIIQSELLKMRHTFSMKLVILAPLVILLLGYLLSNSYVQLSAYNWWYSMILPLVVSLCSASMIVREKKNGMQNIVCLPVRFNKIWMGKTVAFSYPAFCNEFSPVDCNNCCRLCDEGNGFSAGWADWVYASFPDLLVADSFYHVVSKFHGVYSDDPVIYGSEHDLIRCRC